MREPPPAFSNGGDAFQREGVDMSHIKREEDSFRSVSAAGSTTIAPSASDAKCSFIPFRVLVDPLR